MGRAAARGERGPGRGRGAAAAARFLRPGGWPGARRGGWAGASGPDAANAARPPFRRSPAAVPSAPRLLRSSLWDPKPFPGRPSRLPRGEKAQAGPTGCSAGPAGAQGPPPGPRKQAPRQSPSESSAPGRSRRWTGRRHCRTAPCARSTSLPGECPCPGSPPCVAAPTPASFGRLGGARAPFGLSE